MRILITGSQGRIGQQILLPFLRPREIVEYDLALGDDILDVDRLKSKMEGCDAVIHMAAVSGPRANVPKEVFKRINVDGTSNVVQCSLQARVKRLICFSSLSSYGCDAWMEYRDATGPITSRVRPYYLPIDESHPSILEYDQPPDWAGTWYGVSKARAEDVCRQAAGKMQVTVFRLGPFGFRPKSQKRKIRGKRLLEDAKRGVSSHRIVAIYGESGECSPNTLRMALLSALERQGDPFETYNVCDGGTGFAEVAKLYFPGLEPSDVIFSAQKLRSLIREYLPLPYRLWIRLLHGV